MAQKPIIAAFDFDGTITTKDSLLPFLFYTTGDWQTVFKLAALSPVFINYLINRGFRQQTKEAILTRFFGGMPIDYFRELGESYAHSSALNKLVRPEALKRIEWHQKQRHRCILVSAAIDTYLALWGQFIGFDDLVCSRIEVSPKGTVTGKLEGVNCWGPEKVRRLAELLGPKENYTLYAYGDSRGDQELLAMADHPFYRRFS